MTYIKNMKTQELQSTSWKEYVNVFKLPIPKTEHDIDLLTYIYNSSLIRDAWINLDITTALEAFDDIPVRFNVFDTMLHKDVTVSYACEPFDTSDKKIKFFITMSFKNIKQKVALVITATNVNFKRGGKFLCTISEADVKIYTDPLGADTGTLAILGKYISGDMDFEGYHDWKSFINKYLIRKTIYFNLADVAYTDRLVVNRTVEEKFLLTNKGKPIHVYVANDVIESGETVTMYSNITCAIYEYYLYYYDNNKIITKYQYTEPYKFGSDMVISVLDTANEITLVTITIKTNYNDVTDVAYYSDTVKKELEEHIPMLKGIRGKSLFFSSSTHGGGYSMLPLNMD